jgi:gliding motility-associated lipoprotein GldH|tara:strand:+ start:8417 stop:8896 length:480 start_codon:yes stop_codon:yes gene_type:complete
MHKVSILIVFILITSCDSTVFFREYNSFSKGWPSSEAVSFSISQIPQTSSNIYVHIRNNNEYPYSNLFLIAELRDSVQTIFRDTLEYAMADPQGKWLGEGFLDVKESKLWWKEGWTPKHEGPFYVDLFQRVRNNGDLEGVYLLDGILNVGIAVEPQIQP